MLDVYRQRCMHQAVELSALKKAMDGRDGRIQAHSSHLNEVVEDLERLLRKNEELEKHVERLAQRLQVEEEWRATALAWMESDQRIHKHVSNVLRVPQATSDHHQPSGCLRDDASFRESLHDILERAKSLERRTTR